jgi:hypothetical protein
MDRGIKCGQHGERRSRGRFVGLATKLTSSRDDHDNQVKEQGKYVRLDYLGARSERLVA